MINFGVVACLICLVERHSLEIMFSSLKSSCFQTVIWERSFSCSIPVAVFFLTIDRSLALLLGLHYKPIHKIIICVLCLLLVAFATAVTLYIYIDGHRPWPTFPSTNGTSFGNGTLPGTNGTLPGTNGTLFGANGTINGTFFGGSGTTNSTLVGGNGTTNGTNFSNYSLPGTKFDTGKSRQSQVHNFQRVVRLCASSRNPTTGSSWFA